MSRQELINNAISKQANALETAIGLAHAGNPVAKSLHGFGNFSSKHPHITAAVLGALVAKFGPSVAQRLIYEGQNAVQSISNPYYGGGYGGNYY